MPFCFVRLLECTVGFRNRSTESSVSKNLPCWHTIGGRAAYILAALSPRRVFAMAPLALAYQPRGTFNIPSFDQSTRFWYQWFLCTDGGAAALRKDPIGFARIQWATWSPRGWFDDAEFERTAENLSHPDWATITLNAYCARWRQGEAWDSRYDDLQINSVKLKMCARRPS
jgi:hypothetical protein